MSSSLILHPIPIKFSWENTQFFNQLSERRLVRFQGCGACNKNVVKENNKGVDIMEPEYYYYIDY